MLVSVQALRALAALAVVTYHALQWAHGGFEIGRAGVDVFFVISGLIIWRVTASRETDPREFVWRRLTRLVPLYWLATLGVFGVALVQPLFLPEVIPSWPHLARSLVFIPHLDPRGLPFPTLPPGWSLDDEMIFYLVFAIALIGPARWRGRTVFTGLLALSVFGFLFPEHYYFLGFNPMLLQFAAGAGLGAAAAHGQLRSRALGAVMLAAALATWIAVRPGAVFTELWRPLLWGVPAVLTVAGVVSLERGGAFAGLSERVRDAAVWFGDGSYAVYLMHLPATAIVAHTVGWSQVWLFLPLSIAASFAAGLAARAWVEKPLLNLLRRGPAARRQAVRAI